MTRITRAGERLSEIVWNKIHTPRKDDYSMVKVLDKVCPRWEEAEYEYVQIDDGLDVLYHVGDVWIRGWDVTGAINERVSKVRSRKRK